MNNLQNLGLKYGTDKAVYHYYLDYYESYLTPFKDSIKKILEIGVKEGNSIRMWREWFDSKVIIEGWDIKDLPEIDNTNLKIVDQTNMETICRNISGIYDFVLDDGLHSQKSIEVSFSVLFPFARYYIIEDLHAPWCENIYEYGKFTIDILEYFQLHNIWNSFYSNNQQTKYIEQFAKVESIYIRGTRENPLSISAIIKNKYYDI